MSKIKKKKKGKLGWKKKEEMKEERKEGVEKEKRKTGGRNWLGEGVSPKNGERRGVSWAGYVHRRWVEREIGSRGMGGCKVPKVAFFFYYFTL